MSTMRAATVSLSTAQSPPADDPQRQLARLPAVLQLTGLGRSTIYRWMKVGKFPKSFPIEGYIVVWSELEIQKWIDSIIE